MGFGTDAQTWKPAVGCGVAEGGALTQQWQCPGSGTPRYTWDVSAGRRDSALGAYSQPANSEGCGGVLS